MIQEYLFVGDEHKKEISEYSYKTVAVETQDIDDSECWIAILSLDGENENSAKMLSAAHKYIIENYSPTLLSNGCSAYFNKSLYPHFNEFERKLRKLLYLKSALSSDEKDSKIIRDLENKDFGEIFTLLFSDSKFVGDVKKTVNEKTWQFTKDEILSALQDISENTLWDKLIGKDIVPLLCSDFLKVKKYRNDVMHAHSMEYSSFSDASKLIKNINEQLDSEIGKIIVEKEADCISHESDHFNSTINDAIKDMDNAKQEKSLQEQLSEIQAAVASVQDSGIMAAIKEYQKLSSSPVLESLRAQLQTPELSSIQKQLQEISKIQIDIPPAIAEIQKLSKIMSQYQIPVSPAISQLQESLKAYKPNSAVEELSKKLKDIIGETN